MERPLSRQPPAENAAVLIDFENFYRARETSYVSAGRTYEATHLISDLRFIDSWVRSLFEGSTLVIVRAYADFSKHRYARTVPELMSHGIEPVLQPALSKFGKNAADLRLAMDASACASSSIPIRSILLVAGDSDYVPVILQLRSLGIEVVVLGFEGSTGSYVRSFARRSFYLFEDLLKADSEKNAKSVEAGDVPITVAYYKMVLEGTNPRLVIVPPEHWTETTDAIFEWMTHGNGVNTLNELDGLVQMALEQKASGGIIASISPVISQLLTSNCFEPIETGVALTGSAESSVQKVRLAPKIVSASAMRARTQETVVKTLHDRLWHLGDSRDLQKREVAELLYGPTPSNDEIDSANNLIDLASGK